MLNLCLLCEMIIRDRDMSGYVISKHKKCGLEWDDVEVGEWGLDFFSAHWKHGEFVWDVLIWIIMHIIYALSLFNIQWLAHYTP